MSITLSLADPRSQRIEPGTEAEQVQHFIGGATPGTFTRFADDIILPMGVQPEIIGHELYHAYEVEITGKTLRMRAGEPGIWKSGPRANDYESAAAIAMQKQIRIEIEKSRQQRNAQLGLQSLIEGSAFIANLYNFFR
jgi:hypothetical protein